MGVARRRTGGWWRAACAAALATAIGCGGAAGGYDAVAAGAKLGARPAGNHPKGVVERGVPPGATLTRDPENGTVRFFRGQDLSRDLDADPAFRATRAAGDAEGVARAFLQHFAALFRLDDPRSELALLRVDVDRFGTAHVRFEQRHRGLPIPGAQLMVHLDRERRVVLANGTYVATPSELAIEPRLSAADARAAARCSDCAAELVVFAEREQETRLAWRLTPPAGSLAGEELTIDALSGDVLRRQPVAIPKRRTLPGGAG